MLWWKIWGWGGLVVVLVAAASSHPFRSRCGEGLQQYRFMSSSSPAGRGGEGSAGCGGLCWFLVAAAGMRGTKERDLAASSEVRRRWARVRCRRGLGMVPGRYSFILLRSSSAELVDIAAR